MIFSETPATFEFCKISFGMGISDFLMFCSEEERSSGSDSGIFQGKISPHRLVVCIPNQTTRKQTTKY